MHQDPGECGGRMRKVTEVFGVTAAVVIALGLGVGIGGAGQRTATAEPSPTLSPVPSPTPTPSSVPTVTVMAKPEVKTVTVEVEKTPASCLAALDLASEGIGYMTETMNLSTSSIRAAGNYDIETIRSNLAKVNDLAAKVEAITPRMATQVAACRAKQ